MKCLRVFFFTLLFILISTTVNADISPDQVKRVQHKLRELGFDAGPVDGILGPKTKAAVKQFQTSQSIPATANLDDKTIPALGLRLTLEAGSQGHPGGLKPAGQAAKSEVSRRQPSKGDGILLSIPFQWYFVAGIVLAVLAIITLKRIERAYRQKGWGYFIAKNSLEFLIPFVVVCSFYFILSTLLSLSANFMNLTMLIHFENMMLRAKSTVAVFNLSPLMVLLIFVLLFILGLLRVGSARIETASKALDRFQKITRRVYTVIVLLCAFTLLGTYAGVPAKNLKVRIKTLRDGYADLVQDLENMVKDRAVNEIVTNAKARLPEPYTGILADADTADDQLFALKSYYRTQKQEWHINIAALNGLDIQRKTSETKVVVFKARGFSTKTIDQKERWRKGTPADITPKKLERLRAKVKRTAAGAKPYLAELLQTKTGRKILCEIPRVFTDQIKKSLLRQCAARYPLAEPLMEVVLNSVHDKNQNDFEKVALRLVDEGLKNPEKTQGAIQKAASRLSAVGNLSMTKETVSKAEALARKTEQRLNEYRNLHAKIEREVNTVRSRQIKTLIADLKNPTPEVRAKAARKLSNTGDIITRGDFNKIVEIMHHGKDVSEKKLYRESHCTWYEYTRSSYYAAEALLGMKSSYVSNQILADAKKAQSQGRTRKRVTDPGWI